MQKTKQVFGLSIFLTLLGLFFFQVAVLGVGEELETVGTPEFGGRQWIWAFFSLLLVVFLAYWGTRFISSKFGGYSAAKHIKVAEVLTLGPNRQLYLLTVNNEVLLLGVTDHAISLIKEYNDDAFAAALDLLSANNNISLPNGFAGLLQGKLNPETDETKINEIVDGKQKLIESLNRLREMRKKK